MKIPLRWIALPILIFSVSSQAETLNITFDTGSEYEARFHEVSNGSGGIFRPAASGGSGFLETTVGDGTTAVLRDPGVQLGENGSLQISLDVYLKKAPESGSDKILLQLGMVPVPMGDMRAASDFVAVRIGVNTEGTINIIALERANGQIRALCPGPAIDLQAGHWYRLTARFANAAAGKVVTSGVVEDLGAEGEQPPAIVARLENVSLNTPNFAPGNPVYPAFRGSIEAGGSKYDNFQSEKSD